MLTNIVCPTLNYKRSEGTGTLVNFKYFFKCLFRFVNHLRK